MKENGKERKSGKHNLITCTCIKKYVKFLYIHAVQQKLRQLKTSIYKLFYTNAAVTKLKKVNQCISTANHVNLFLYSTTSHK